MEKFINYDRTTTTIKPETLTVKTNDLSHFKFTLTDEDIKAFKKFGELMIDIARTGGEAMARAIGNTYPGNFDVDTDESCRMINRVSSKPTKDINKDWNNFLLEMIEATVAQELHLGDNLKQQYLDYLKEIKATMFRLFKEIKDREKKEGRL